MAMNKFRDILERFSDQLILVIGDCMLDEYVYGDVRRVSPEAPVPVVDVERVECVPGGAANTALNIRALGAHCRLVGVVGADLAGDQLITLLDAAGVDTSGLQRCNDRPTTKKTRIVARSQQIVRTDVETAEPVLPSAGRKLVKSVAAAAAGANCCVISDYAKGVVCDRTSAQFIAETNRIGIASLVDPKGRDFTRYARATLVKPNHLETEVAVNRIIRTADELDEAAAQLRRDLVSSALLITRGADGMSFYGADQPVHLPTEAATVYDVTGAGDTVISTLAVAHASGADLLDAARIANTAAAIAVSRQGTVAVTQGELALKMGV